MNDLSLYRDYRPRIQNGSLIQWRGNYVFSKGIRRVTGEDDNHSSIAIRLDIFPGRVFSIEALDDGLHLWPLSTLVQKYDGERISVYPIKPNHIEDATESLKWLLAHLGTGYDWTDCLSNWRTLLGFKPEPADALQLYCSESIFLSFRERKFDTESGLWMGAGLPILRNMTHSPVPGRPMIDLGIWLDESNPILIGDDFGTG